MTAGDISELRLLFCGYFYEDWRLEAAESDEVIYQFLRDGWSPNEIVRIVVQIDRSLNDAKDDFAIKCGLFEELGCYYLPSADGMSTRDWLQHVADVLRKHDA